MRSKDRSPAFVPSSLSLNGLYTFRTTITYNNQDHCQDSNDNENNYRNGRSYKMIFFNVKINL